MQFVRKSEELSGPLLCPAMALGEKDNFENEQLD
jgi:hypothetical protein